MKQLNKVNLCAQEDWQSGSNGKEKNCRDETSCYKVPHLNAGCASEGAEQELSTQRSEKPSSMQRLVPNGKRLCTRPLCSDIPSMPCRVKDARLLSLQRHVGRTTFIWQPCDTSNML
eukprot:4288011-Pleurochrysis_carterae.AAC.6